MARTFNGSTQQYLTAAVPCFVNPPFTIACWVNVATVEAHHCFMFCGDVGSDNDYHDMYYHHIDNEVVSKTQGTGVSALAVSDSDLTASTWYHLASVTESTSHRVVYVNGSAGTPDTTAMPVTSANLDTTAIGVVQRVSRSLYMTGAIAEAAVWGVALDSTDIGHLYTDKWSPSRVKPWMLKHYWPLIDDDNDAAGGVDMTPMASPTFTTHVPGIVYPVATFYPGLGSLGLS